MIYNKVVVLLFLILSITACGGGGSGGNVLKINTETPSIPSEVNESLNEISELLEEFNL